MSWDQFVATQLQRKRSNSGWIGNCLESAAILSAENAGVWACTPEFKLMRYVLPVPDETDPETFSDVEVDEAEGLIKAVSDGEPPSKAGIRVAGIKYMKLRYDPNKNLLYLRKSGLRNPGKIYNKE